MAETFTLFIDSLFEQKNENFTYEQDESGASFCVIDVPVGESRYWHVVAELGSEGEREVDLYLCDTTSREDIYHINYAFREDGVRRTDEDWKASADLEEEIRDRIYKSATGGDIFKERSLKEYRRRTFGKTAQAIMRGDGEPEDTDSEDLYDFVTKEADDIIKATEEHKILTQLFRKKFIDDIKNSQKNKDFEQEMGLNDQLVSLVELEGLIALLRGNIQ